MFGSHLSIAGALVNAIDAAVELKLDTVQIFTKNQRQWNVPALKDSDQRDWLSALKRNGWQTRTVSHATYLMNLASPDPELRKKSTAMMADELERCAQLSIPYLVAHPGAHLGQGVEEGLRTIARSVAPIFKSGVGSPTILCLENTAGSGTTLGRTFEELAMLRAMILEESSGDAAPRIGYCLDTCHALAAGYDLSSTDPVTGKKRTNAAAEKVALEVFAEFDRLCGIANLRVFHLNDSKGAHNSRIDRHDHIGHGNVAPGAFSAIVNHPKLSKLPLILETPKENDPEGRPWDAVNTATLKKLIRKTPAGV